MSHGPSHEGGSCEPNLTPLLDVVLQLIMFFMITVNFVNTEHINQDVVLPEAQSAVAMDQSAENWIFLNLNKEGKLVGALSHLKTRQGILEFLKTEKKQYDDIAILDGKREAKVIVILRAHKEARYRDVWDILNLCTEAGIKKWQLRLVKKLGGAA
jgi:biopolymer transport protein ExbD